jgi:tetratricopeptide (TPR) repeat protein
MQRKHVFPAVLALACAVAVQCQSQDPKQEPKQVPPFHPSAASRPEYLRQDAACTQQILSGHFAAAEPLCQKALETAERLPPDFFEPEKMRAYSNAGTVAYELKKFPQALEDFQKQYQLARHALAAGSPQMIHLRGNLAHSHLALHQLAEADAEYTETEKAIQAAEDELEKRRAGMKAEAYEGVKASYEHNLQVILQEHVALLRRMGKVPEAQALEQRAAAPENK